MIKAILTDIEGTTTSISFVKDVLFPYARQMMVDFVKTHENDCEIAKILKEIETREKLPAGDVERILDKIFQWMDEDQKITPLKTLQGLIWEKGYRNGDLKAHIYPDAYECLQKWKNEGLEIFVYSSGSVHAQKLLFAHTGFGNLNRFFSGYFDTSIGSKKEVSSYQKIAEIIAQSPQEVLFLSDAELEIEAALKAGMQAFLICREQISTHNGSFYEIDQYTRNTL